VCPAREVRADEGGEVRGARAAYIAARDIEGAHEGLSDHLARDGGGHEEEEAIALPVVEPVSEIHGEVFAPGSPFFTP